MTRNFDKFGRGRWWQRCLPPSLSWSRQVRRYGSKPGGGCPFQPAGSRTRATDAWCRGIVVETGHDGRCSKPWPSERAASACKTGQRSTCLRVQREEPMAGCVAARRKRRARASSSDVTVVAAACRQSCSDRCSSRGGACAGCGCPRSAGGTSDCRTWTPWLDCWQEPPASRGAHCSRMGNTGVGRMPSI